MPKDKYNWQEDEKNLATKPLFNQILFGVLLIGIVIGVRHIEIFGDLRGYFVTTVCAILLLVQNFWTWNYIDYLKRGVLNAER